MFDDVGAGTDWDDYSNQHINQQLIICKWLNDTELTQFLGRDRSKTSGIYPNVTVLLLGENHGQDSNNVESTFVKYIDQETLDIQMIRGNEYVESKEKKTLYKVDEYFMQILNQFKVIKGIQLPTDIKNLHDLGEEESLPDLEEILKSINTHFNDYTVDKIANEIRNSFDGDEFHKIRLNIIILSALKYCYNEFYQKIYILLRYKIDPNLNLIKHEKIQYSKLMNQIWFI